MQEGKNIRLDHNTLAWVRKNPWCEEFAVKECNVCGLFYKPELRHVCDKSPKLEFNRKIGNIELRACPASLARLRNDDPNTTIDIVMWHKDSSGKPYCFSIAYWRRDDEGYELKFVGARPFLYVDDSRISELWKVMLEAQAVLDAWFDETEDDG